MAMIRLPDSVAADALRAAAGVARLEQDLTRTAEGTPSDALFSDQWALERIGWTEVYGAVDPAATTVVAILDTGVAADHPDLAGRLLPGRSYVDGAAADTDINGHGTWMAGIVGAATDNAAGVAGVAWGAVRILPITVLDADGRGQDSAVIEGLVDAVDSGADVVLLAFSSPDYSRALQAAIDYAWANDVVIVAAAGNDGSSSPAYPAGDRGVVGVASTDRRDSLTPGSNSGAAVFMGAPGVDISTTFADGGYGVVNGTSAAAALVAGSVALVRAVDPAASNGAVVARLARNAAEPALGTTVGNGRVDLARTLADHNMTAIQPAGAGPVGDGGPFIGPYVAAATATWTGGGGDNNWTTPGNWGGTAPVAGDDLVFPAGAARLSNTNDYTAGTSFNSITLSGTGYTLSGNSVALGVGGMTSSAAGSVNTVSFAMSFAADRTITVSDSTSTVTLGGIVSGAGGLIKAGSGALALSAVDTYTGATSIGAGSVDIQSNAALGGTGTGTTVTAGAAITINGSGLVVAEPLTLNGTGISGAGAVRNLVNNNTWSGAVTLGSATTIASTAGTLTLSGAVTTATFTVTYSASGNITKSAGVIAGTGGVTKEGAGTLTFGVANTFSGATTITTGTLKLSVANGVGSSSAVTVASGATFDLGGFSDTVGSIAGAGSVTSTSAGTVTLTTSASTSTTFSGVMSDGGGVVGITKAGTGTLTWSGANTYTGVTRINAGTLSIASDAVLGTAPVAPTAGQLTFGGGTLQATASFTLSTNRGVAMTGVGTLNVDPSMTLTYGGVIAGASTLTKSGTGTLVLSGANTHSGTTALSAGVLRIQSNAALGGTTTGSTIASGAVIEIDGSGLSIGEPITSLIGTGVSSGGAIRNLANDNTWTAAITLGSGGARINSDGGTLTLSGGVTGNGLSLTVGGAGNVTESGVIATTTGGLTKDGAGTGIVSAANTYTGATTVNAGGLRLGVSDAIGSSSALTVASGATFDLGGFSDTVGSLAGAGSITNSVLGSATLTSGAKNTSTTFSGAINDGGGVVSIAKEGTATLTLSGVNSYTGPTAINGGTISIAADSGIGTAPGSPTAGQLAFNGGTLLVSATFSLDSNRGVALSGAGTFSVNAGITLTYGGVIAGAGTLTKIGTGTLVLGGASTFTGSTTITAGTVSISTATALGAPPASPTPGQLTFNGGTLLVTADVVFNSNRGFALTGAGTVSVNPGVTVSYGGVIAGTGTLTKTGTGTFALSGSSTYSSVTTLSAGVIRVQSNSALGASSAGTTVASGTSIEIDGAGLSIAEPITSLTGTGISAAGAMRNLANDNTWSGAITLAGATRISSDGGTLTLSAGIGANTRALTIGGGGNSNVFGISGTTASLTKDGAGITILSDVDTFTGVTTVNAGTLKLAIADAVGSSSATTVAASATFDLAGFSDTLGSLAGAGTVTSSAIGTATLTAGGLNTNTTFSGAISDGSGVLLLVKVGSGTLTLSGTSTYTGRTTVNAGTVSIGADAALGSAPALPTTGQLTLSGGTLLVSANFSLDSNRGVALVGAGTFSINSSRTLTFGGVVSGSGTLTKIGSGTLVLAGANTYTGATTIGAGTLSIAAGNALGPAPASPTPGQLAFNGGTLLATADFTFSPSRGISLAGAGTFNIGAGVTVTYGGVIDGPGALTKSGTGTLILSGANTYTAPTTLSAGVLSVAADAALGTAPAVPVATQLVFSGGTLQATATFTIDSNRGLTLSGSGTISVDPDCQVSYGGVIAGGGNLTKAGIGSLVLAGANPYTGTTTVSAGVLRVQSATALGDIGGGSSVTIGAGIEIDGAGLVVAEPITSLRGTGFNNLGALRNLGGNNEWSGAVMLGSGGASAISDAGTLTLSGGVTGNARALTIDGDGDTLINSVIATTSGSLTKDGLGTLTLAALNSYTGATAVNAGTLKLGISDAIGGSSAMTVASGATLDLHGFSDTVGSLAGAGDITSSAAGSITLTCGGLNSSTTFSGIIGDGSAVIALTAEGSGTLTLSGSNTYTGPTTINAGTLSIADDNALGIPPLAPTTGRIIFGGGTLLASSSFTLNSNRGVTLASDGTVSINSGVIVDYGGIIGGTGGLTKAGNGSVVLSGVNIYSGPTHVDKGTLSIAADAALGTPPATPTAGQLTFAGGTLEVSDSFSLDSNRGIDLIGDGTFSVDPGVTLVVGATIEGAGDVTKSDTGVLVLSAANIYGGATTVSGGSLRVQNSLALGDTLGGTSVTSGEAIELDGTGLNIAEPLTSLRGTGDSGAGALRNLANDNTWSGAIILGSGGARVNSDAGTLTLSGGFTGDGRPLTVGGDGDTIVVGVIDTANGTLTKDGLGTLTLGVANAYTERTIINAGVLSIASDGALGTPPGTFDGNQLTFGGGTLATTASMTLDPNRGISWGSGGGTFDVAAGTTLTYAGIATGSSGSGVTTKAGAGTLDYSAATSTSGGLTIAAGTLIAPTAQIFDINGDLTNNSGVGAIVVGDGTVTLSRANGPQVIGGAYPIDFNGLTISNPAGVSITYDATVTGILTLSDGNITTASQVLYLDATASVSRTSGHVVGNLRKYVPTGATEVTFEIGDDIQYAPVTVAFSSDSLAGDLTASTTAGDHSALASSSIDPTQSANRFWTLTASGLSFTDAAAEFTFGPGDVDAGADTTDFGIARYAAGSWHTLTTQTQAATSTSATGITAFGDFAVGELAPGALDHFTVTAPASAAVGGAFDVAVTAVDASGNRVGSYVGAVTFSSSDPHAVFAPASYTFLAADHGTKTFSGIATLYRAGSQTVSVADGAFSGTSGAIAVSAGAFEKLQILVPGETADAGSATGKTGPAAAQTAHTPFSVTVNAVDSYWNIVASTDTVTVTSSDANAALPPAAALVAGSATFSVTLETGGATTVTATDSTDGTKTAATSASISVTNTAPTAVADSYEMFADNTLTVSAAGVLANDTDAESQPLSVGAPRPASGPSHGSLTLNADGSFTYTPTAGYDGPDSFTYTAADVGTTSTPGTVTIVVRDHSLISASGWATSFSSSRYLALSYPNYVPVGAIVAGATLNLSYRSLDAAGTLCYYIETYNGATLMATHGSAAAPISCNSGASYAADVIDLTEIASADAANHLTIRIYMRDSAGARSQINAAILGINYSVP